MEAKLRQDPVLHKRLDQARLRQDEYLAKRIAAGDESAKRTRSEKAEELQPAPAGGSEAISLGEVDDHAMEGDGSEGGRVRPDHEPRVR